MHQITNANDLVGPGRGGEARWSSEPAPSPQYDQLSAEPI